MHQKTTLPNGLRLITADLPHTKAVSVTLFIGVGSRYEKHANNGISHFVEHMLFKGTWKRPTAMAISECIECVGGAANAETGKEMTVYWVKVPATHVELAIDLLADIVLNSRLDSAELDRERRVVVEEINMLMDSPQDVAEVQFDSLLWGDHPMGWDIAGKKETVAQLQREHLVDFMNTHYVPNRAVLSIAGPIPREEMEKLALQAFGQWQPQNHTSQPEPCLATPGPAITIEKKKTEQAYLCLGVPGCSYLHPDRFSLDVLNVILGEGMSSRLFQELREKRGLAYDVHSSVQHYADAGVTEICAGVDPANTRQAIEAILEEVDKLRNPIEESELAKAKEMWKGRLILRTEDSGALASWYGGQELLMNRTFTPDEVIAAIQQVTAEDVARVTSRLFVTEGLHASVVGPYKPADEPRLAKVLKW